MVKKNDIHPTACVHPKAKLGKNVCVGAYSVIGEKATIGEGTCIGNSCLIDGNSRIGSRCKIFTGAVIGSIPQDLKYKGEDTQVIIGDDNVIREYVTVNLGTGDKGKTQIGNANLLMAYSHVAHDCEVGNNVIIANVGTLAGHVTVEDRVIIGGMTAVHQFVRICKMAIIGGCSKVIKDIPPFMMADGHPARVYGLNSVGLKRAQVSPENVRNLKAALKLIFREGLPVSKALEKIKSQITDDSYVTCLLNFISNSQRGICKGSQSDNS